MIPGNVCVHAEGIVKPMKTLVLIQHHFEIILLKKYTCHTKLSAPTTRRKLHWNKSVATKVCLVWSLLLGKSYTEIKTWKFALKTSEMFWKKISFETEHLSQPFDNKSWY